MGWLERLDSLETPSTRTDKTDKSPSVSYVSTVPGPFQQKNGSTGLCGIPVSELRDIAGRDWLACQSDPELLEALALAVSARRMREHGEVPPGWDHVTTCKRCGDVPIFAGFPTTVEGCPWCLVRISGKPIPAPMTEPSAA